MDFDRENVRLVVNEDRLSSLPDELIYQILSCIDDTRFVVQTCLLLSPRWKLLWTSVPRLSFSSHRFRPLPKFSKFVTNVLSRRNDHVEVSSVKLDFDGAVSQVFVKKIANYAFSHNVQELIVISWPKNYHEYPPCLFSSTSLKHFTFTSSLIASDRAPKIPKTPWNFPALTTLHLSEITLCVDQREYLDLFSKCVNLKDLSLKSFNVAAKVFDIITTRLSSLVLIKSKCSTLINVIAPQLENLTIIDCPINHLDAPPGLSSLCYTGHYPPKWFKGCFRSLNKVSVSWYLHNPSERYTLEDACETVNVLQELHSARFLTLHINIVQCLSTYPDLVSHHPSPFSNLICLNIDSSMRRDAYKVKMSTEARNFLLENSPSATFIMDLPEEPPTKAMKAKEARKKRAKLVADIESCMLELQSSLLEQEHILVERKQTKEKTKLAIENLMAELLHVLTKIKIMQSEPEKAHSEEVVAGMKAQISTHLEEMRDLSSQEYDDVIAIKEKKVRVGVLLECLAKRPRADMEARYSHQLEETEKLSERLFSETVSSRVIYSHNQYLLQQLSVSDSMSNFSLFIIIKGGKMVGLGNRSKVSFSTG